MISSDADIKVTIQNKLESTAGGKLFPAARLTMTRTITDDRNREHIFEEIIWQSSYSIESLTEGLVLYRSHSGINLEDKVLQENKYDWERELFVPICSGVTFFNISATSGDNLLERWDGTPPTGVAVTISFDEPFKNFDGTYGVPEEDKIIRTVAIDRTRKIQFNIAGAGGQTGNQQMEKKDTDLPGSKVIPPKTSKQPTSKRR